MDPRYQIYAHILKTSILRFFGIGRIDRTQSRVREEYSGAWRRSISGLSQAKYKMYKLEPAFFNGKLVKWASVDRKKYYLGKISEEINKSACKKVLEIGSGNGFNLLALSVLNPNVEKWIGIELTEEGIAASNKFLETPPIEALAVATGLDRNIILEKINSSKIEFIRGDILKSQFQNNEFDFVFTLLVIEQIPHLYKKALSEAYRVASSRAVFIEAFVEAQDSIFQRMNLANVDHFRGSIDEAKRAGFSILKFEPLALNEIKFHLGLLVCSK